MGALQTGFINFVNRVVGRVDVSKDARHRLCVQSRFFAGNENRSLAMPAVRFV